jgi:hypothetical protein
VKTIDHRTLITALHLALADRNYAAINALLECVEERARCTEAINASKAEPGAVRLMAELEEPERWDGQS